MWTTISQHKSSHPSTHTHQTVIHFDAHRDRTVLWGKSCISFAWLLVLNESNSDDCIEHYFPLVQRGTTKMAYWSRDREGCGLHGPFIRELNIHNRTRPIASKKAKVLWPIILFIKKTFPITLIWSRCLSSTQWLLRSSRMSFSLLDRHSCMILSRSLSLCLQMMHYKRFVRCVY